jgi:hypothetical protein
MGDNRATHTAPIRIQEKQKMSERARARAREGEERESVCASLHFYEWVADENMRGKGDSWDVLTTTISITARSISEDTDSVDGFSRQRL